MKIPEKLNYFLVSDYVINVVLVLFLLVVVCFIITLSLTFIIIGTIYGVLLFVWALVSDICL